MNAYRLVLQQFLLDHGLNREPSAYARATAGKPSSPYDRLETFTVGIFLGGWLLAILSHL